MKNTEQERKAQIMTNEAFARDRDRSLIDDAISKAIRSEYLNAFREVVEKDCMPSYEKFYEYAFYIFYARN